MCGLFGFVADGEKRVDLGLLEAVAEQTMSRGRDAFGFAWVDSLGRLKHYKQTGKIGDRLGLLAMARDARMLIGHTRWATQGTPRDNSNNHPHPADGGWLVHNGMIPGYRRIVKQFALHPVSECDTEVLSLMVERSPGSYVQRMIRASEMATGSPLAIAAIWNRPDRLVIVRRGNPVSMGTTKDGYYFASEPDALPDDAQSLANEHTVEFTKGAVKVRPIPRTKYAPVAAKSEKGWF